MKTDTTISVAVVSVCLWLLGACGETTHSPGQAAAGDAAGSGRGGAPQGGRSAGGVGDESGGRSASGSGNGGSRSDLGGSAGRELRGGAAGMGAASGRHDTAGAGAGGSGCDDWCDAASCCTNAVRFRDVDFVSQGLAEYCACRACPADISEAEAFLAGSCTDFRRQVERGNGCGLSWLIEGPSELNNASGGEGYVFDATGRLVGAFHYSDLLLADCVDAQGEGPQPIGRSAGVMPGTCETAEACYVCETGVAGGSSNVCGAAGSGGSN